MSLAGFLQVYQAPALLLLAVFGPSILSRTSPLLLQKRHHSKPNRPRTALSGAVKVLLALHTLYCISSLLIPPYDIFTSHSLPILAPNDLLRATVLRQPRTVSTVHPSRLGEVSSLIDNLLSRLANLETRYLYARFGHQPLKDCLWCQDINDFLLASLPSIVGQYLVEAALIGALGISWIEGSETPARAARWKGPAGWALVVMAAAEVGAKYLWDIRAVEGDCLHLASTIHNIRTACLLLLPIIYTFLPLPSSPPLASVIPALSNANSTLRLTSLARSAVQRSPALRRIWGLVGEDGVETGRIGNADEHVRNASRALGLDRETIRSNGGAWIREGWRGMVRFDQNGMDKPNA